MTSFSAILVVSAALAASGVLTVSDVLTASDVLAASGVLTASDVLVLSISVNLRFRQRLPYFRNMYPIPASRPAMITRATNPQRMLVSTDTRKSALSDVSLQLAVMDTT